jgi:hypothetical protein
MSTTLALLLRAAEPGLLRGGVTLAADDGTLLRIGLVAHALAGAVFDATRAAVEGARSLAPLAAAAAALERNAAQWDEEYARQGAVDPRAAGPPNPELSDAPAGAGVEGGGGGAGGGCGEGGVSAGLPIPAPALAPAPPPPPPRSAVTALPPPPPGGDALLERALAVGTTPLQVLDCVVAAQRGGSAHSAAAIATAILAHPLPAFVLDGVTAIVPELQNLERAPYATRVADAARDALALQPPAERARARVPVGTPADAATSSASGALRGAAGDGSGSPGWHADVEPPPPVTLNAEQLRMPLGGTHALLVPLVPLA